MIPIPDSICPLCSQVFPRELLIGHITSEPPRLRQRTIKVIRAYHPGWTEEHGACGPCWRSYREASRILNLMKSARPQNADGFRGPPALAALRQDKDYTNPHDAH